VDDQQRAVVPRGVRHLAQGTTVILDCH
jgi:hypothetical protein